MAWAFAPEPFRFSDVLLPALLDHFVRTGDEVEPGETMAFEAKLMLMALEAGLGRDNE